MGGTSGRIALRSARKQREPLRSRSHIRQYAVHVNGGQEYACTRPDQQADSPKMLHRRGLAVDGP